MVQASEFADKVEMAIVDWVNRCTQRDLLKIGKVALGDNNEYVKGLEVELKSKPVRT